MVSQHAFRSTIAAVVIGTIAFSTDAARATELRQVSHQLFDGDMRGYKYPTWSSDGATLAVIGSMAGREPYHGLVGLDLDGNLAEWPPHIWDMFLWRPSFNPSQTRVALGVFLHNLVDRDEPPVRLAPLSARNPAWSPQGGTVVVDADVGLVIVDVESGVPHHFTTRADDETPAWSPDGSAVVFSSTRGGFRDLWIKDVETGELLQLTNDEADDLWPSWSPRGDWIAFASNREGTYDIWVRHVHSDAAVLIAGGPARDLAPAWSPDGRAIAYESDAQIWLATGLPDVILPVTSKSWSQVKDLYRD